MNEGGGKVVIAILVVGLAVVAIWWVFRKNAIPQGHVTVTAAPRSPSGGGDTAQKIAGQVAGTTSQVATTAYCVAQGGPAGLCAAGGKLVGAISGFLGQKGTSWVEDIF